jgi:hypothetical protein
MDQINKDKTNESNYSKEKHAVWEEQITSQLFSNSPDTVS